MQVFGKFELDRPRRELRRDGKLVEMRPQVFDLLCLLIDERDRVLTKRELLDHLWPDEIVSEYALTSAIKAVRLALGDDGKTQSWIRTAHGKGYRFAGDVAEKADVEAAESDAEPATPPVADSEAALAVLRSGRSDGPLFGRSRELYDISSSFDLARAGSTQITLLTGEPGIGKTRLAREAAAAAAAQGARVLVGRCEQSATLPLWPWAQIVRTFLGGTDDATLARTTAPFAVDIAQIVPSLRDRMPDLPEAPEFLDEDEARLCLFESMTAWLDAISREAPLVVVVDDLHWADSATVLLVRHVVRELADAPLLLIGTYREGEASAGSPLARLLHFLARSGHGDPARLMELPDDAAAHMVDGLVEDAEKKLVERVVTAAGGNPFFLEELSIQASSAAKSGQPTPVVPEKVREAIKGRLASLSDRARSALSVAAVIGHRFDVGLLTAVTDIPMAELAQILDEATRVGVLAEPERVSGSCRFAHALIAETLYASVSRLRRVRTHERIANILEAMAEGDDRYSVALARHFAAAATPECAEKAIAHLLDAAATDERRFAHPEAAAATQKALELADEFAPENKERRFDLQVRLGRAVFEAGDGPRAREIFFEAVASARELERNDLLTRAAAELPGAWAYTDEPVIDLLDEAARVSEDGSSPPAVRARVLSKLAGALVGSNDLDRRHTLCREARELARKAEDPLVQMRVSSALQPALWWPDPYRERRELATEQIELATRLGKSRMRLDGLGWRIVAAAEAGDLNAVRDDLDEHESLVDQVRSPMFRASAKNFRAMLALVECRFEDAERLAQEAFEIGSPVNPTTAIMGNAATMYYLRFEQERIDEVAPMVEAFTGQIDELRWDWLRAYLCMARGDVEGCRAIYAELAADRFGESAPPRGHSNWITAMMGLAHMAWWLGDADGATDLDRLLEPHSDRWVSVGQASVCLGSVRLGRARLATARNRTDQAIALYEEAARAHEDAGALMPLLQSQVELARVLADTGEGQRATTLAKDVAARAGDLSYERMVTAAESIQA